MDTDFADINPVRGASAADLDPDLVRAYLAARDREAGRIPCPPPGIGPRG